MDDVYVLITALSWLYIYAAGNSGESMTAMCVCVDSSGLVGIEWTYGWDG